MEVSAAASRGSPRASSRTPSTTAAATVAQLATIDAHVSNCMFCAYALADESATTTTWERRGLLGRLVRADSL
jgi:hypothetical protein